MGHFIVALAPQYKNAIATSAGSINYGDLFKSAVEQLPIQINVPEKGTNYPVWSDWDKKIAEDMRRHLEDTGYRFPNVMNDRNPALGSQDFMVGYEFQGKLNLTYYNGNLSPSSIDAGNYKVGGSGVQQMLPLLEFFVDIVCDDGQILDVKKGKAIACVGCQNWLAK